MQRNIRRVDVLASWRRAQAELAAMADEIAALRRERDELLAALNELRAARFGVAQAQAELASLYRERELQRARSIERDFGQPLN
jgi:hypothetical protein